MGFVVSELVLGSGEQETFEEKFGIDILNKNNEMNNGNSYVLTYLLSFNIKLGFFDNSLTDAICISLYNLECF